MHSRAPRILLVIICVCGVAAATYFIRTLEMTVAARRSALHDFDRLASDTTDALGDVRAAQQAYVAFGQGAAFWMSKVDATTQRVTDLLTMLQPTSISATSKSFLDQAVAAFTEFGTVDTRIRNYLKTGAQLMAADIVFSEGRDAIVATSQRIERARLEEQVAFDQLEAGNKKMEMAAAGGAAAAVLLVTVILALVPLARRADTAIASNPLSLLSPVEPRAAVAVARPPVSDDLPLRSRDRDDAEAKARLVAVPAIETPRHATPLPLQSIAQICTDIGRVGDPNQLKELLARAAEVLDASGVVLWLGTPSGTELRPALAHGYGPDVVSRIPVVPRSANNAAAAAFRSGTLQIVPSQADAPAKGAVVAPLLSADGCVGVLSAEIRDGGEASATVQSLAAIFAAQFAGVVASTAAAPEQRAAGGGAA